MIFTKAISNKKEKFINKKKALSQLNLSDAACVKLISITDHLDDIVQTLYEEKTVFSDKVEEAYGYISDIHYGLVKVYANLDQNKIRQKKILSTIKKTNKKMKEMDKKLNRILEHLDKIDSYILFNKHGD